MGKDFTPREIVERLDQYIIGQQQAKKSVAVALRNRYRWMQLDPLMKEEIVPKNILMIGPTGVGKTEIARRLAKLVRAPFVKVEATKFTEVGYVGRDVESMVRDLVEVSIRMVKEEKTTAVLDKAEQEANKELVRLLVPTAKKSKTINNPLEMLFSADVSNDEDEDEASKEEVGSKRKQIEKQLALGELENRLVTIEIEESSPSMFDALQGSGMEQMGMNMQNTFEKFMPKNKTERKVPVSEARGILTQQHAQKLVDMDEVSSEAIYRAENTGIIFIDEIDKIASKEGQHEQVSREGVQRDILPIVEGSSVMTKYGSVKTDHMLFVAAGAFHTSKPSDLIPELQGRFPIRVELDKLTTEDFIRILREPSNALLKQYEALLKTEGINIHFTDEAIHKIAEIAFEVNQETDNIGARRLHTILEKLLEDLSFEATEITLDRVEVNAQYVDEKLANIVKNKDLSRFIL